MQLKMATRRSLNGSMTVVGDLAQATGPLAPEGWDDVLAHLPDARPARVVGLSVGYRIPAQIMELADRVMAAAAPDLRPPRAVRIGDTSPSSRPSSPATTWASPSPRRRPRWSPSCRAATWPSSSPMPRPTRCSAALDAAGIDHGRATRTGLDDNVTVVPVSVVKGLELDGVVVVEPACLVAADRRRDGRAAGAVRRAHAPDAAARRRPRRRPPGCDGGVEPIDAAFDSRRPILEAWAGGCADARAPTSRPSPRSEWRRTGRPGPDARSAGARRRRWCRPPVRAARHDDRGRAAHRAALHGDDPGAGARRRACPGSAPYTRGRTPLGHRADGWDVRQRVVASDDRRRRRCRSVTSWSGGPPPSSSTSRARPLDGAILDAALDGVHLELLTLVLDAGPAVGRGGRHAGRACGRARGLAPDAVAAVLGADPVGQWAASGGTRSTSAADGGHRAAVGAWRRRGTTPTSPPSSSTRRGSTRPVAVRSTSWRTRWHSACTTCGR